MLEHVGLGVYGLPGSAAKAYMPINRQIVQAVIAAPGHLITRVELQAAVGRPVDARVCVLRKSGVLAPPTGRGLVTLSAASLAKIKRGEALRDGRGSILWTPVSARPAA
jgi:hypothetical protein